MSNLRKFIDAVDSGEPIPRELAVEVADYIRQQLEAAARGGKKSKRPPVKTDRASELNRKRVRAFRERISLE